MDVQQLISQEASGFDDFESQMMGPRLYVQYEAPSLGLRYHKIWHPTTFSSGVMSDMPFMAVLGRWPTQTGDDCCRCYQCVQRWGQSRILAKDIRSF
jgi:hypothetical protein